MVNIGLPQTGRGLIILALTITMATACSGSKATRGVATTLPSTAEQPTPTEAKSKPATPTPTLGPTTPRVEVTGLFSGEPPPGLQPPVATRTLGPRPASPFAAWDGKQTVIYDTKTSTEIDLGDVSQVVFSPDSTRAAWIAGHSTAAATVMNLATRASRTYAEGSNVGFVDDRRLAVYHAERSAYEVFDLDTGQPSPDQSIPPDQPLAGYQSYPPSPSGYYWRTTPDPTTQLKRGGAGRSSFRLIEIGSGATALQFDAVFAAPAGPGEIVLATPLDGAMTNIFIVEIKTGKAAFVARARYGDGPNWPLSATPRYVLWTDNYCSVDPPQGHMQLYDRQAKTLTDIADDVAPSNLYQESLRYGKLTAGGSIALGSFGASAVVDPVSLAYTAVLPGGVTPSFRPWSPDYRYASYAPGGGHGGLC